ncbi:MAG: zeta toxin family protein [Deltaproteobacteria bacterium]|jgi:hypothetical protein|nr:zeta toxin family protein [Deltaproteobacteria bacterium]
MGKNQTHPEGDGKKTRWTSEEAIDYECARGLISDYHAIVSFRIGEARANPRLDPKKPKILYGPHLSLYDRMIGLHVHDREAVARTLEEFPRYIRAWREQWKDFERVGVRPNPETYRLSEKEHQIIFSRDIKPQLFSKPEQVDRPVAVFIGGQPGAGKTAAVDAASEELDERGGAVQIIAEDLRSFHPFHDRLMIEDDETAAFLTNDTVEKWIKKTLAKVKAKRVNVVIEDTMADGKKVTAAMRNLRKAGYEIDVRALAVDWNSSERHVERRREKQKELRGYGRVRPAEARRAAYEGMLTTLARVESRKMADRVTIDRLGNVSVYANELQNGEWSRKPMAKAVAMAERAFFATSRWRRSFSEGFAESGGPPKVPELQVDDETVLKMMILWSRLPPCE